MLIIEQNCTSRMWITGIQGHRQTHTHIHWKAALFLQVKLTVTRKNKKGCKKCMTAQEIIREFDVEAGENISIVSSCSPKTAAMQHCASLGDASRQSCFQSFRSKYRHIIKWDFIGSHMIKKNMHTCMYPSYSAILQQRLGLLSLTIYAEQMDPWTL